jgi:predicted Zn-dependent protease
MKRILIFIGAFLFLSCASLLTTKDDPVIMPEFMELQFGLSTKAQVEKTYKLYEDREVNNYISMLGNKLVSFSDRKNLNYEFYVVDSDEVNAFAVPGGFIYVTTGIIKALDNEAQIACVIGHEIGHVVKKHSVKFLQRAIIANYGIEFLSDLIGGKQGDKKEITKIISTIGINFLFLKNSRENEYEADEQGAYLAAMAGYDPYAMIDVQKHLMELRKSQPSKLEEFLSTHPLSENRISHLQEFIPQNNLKGNIKNTDNYLKIKNKLKK